MTDIIPIRTVYMYYCKYIISLVKDRYTGCESLGL